MKKAVKGKIIYFIFVILLLFISCTNAASGRNDNGPSLNDKPWIFKGNTSETIDYTIKSGPNLIEKTDFNGKTKCEVSAAHNVYKIILEYESKGPEGTKMSGAVYIPENCFTSSGGSFSITDEIKGIVLANHCTISTEDLAPSKKDYYDEALFAANCNFIVCMADYAGFGSDSGHYQTFCEKRYLARESIDMLKATKKFAKDRGWNTSDAKYYNIGHSEGGFVVFAVAEYAKENGITFSGSYSSAPSLMTETFIGEMLNIQSYAAVTEYLLLNMYGLKAVYGDKAGYNCEDLLSEDYKNRYGMYLDDWLKIKKVNQNIPGGWNNGKPIMNTGTFDNNGNFNNGTTLLIDNTFNSVHAGMREWGNRTLESSFESTESISKIKDGSNENIHIWCAQNKKDMICYKENLPSVFQSENYLKEVEVNNSGDAHNFVYKSFLTDLLTKPNYGIK